MAKFIKKYWIKYKRTFLCSNLIYQLCFNQSALCADSVFRSQIYLRCKYEHSFMVWMMNSQTVLCVSYTTWVTLLMNANRWPVFVPHPQRHCCSTEKHLVGRITVTGLHSFLSLYPHVLGWGTFFFSCNLTNSHAAGVKVHLSAEVTKNTALIGCRALSGECRRTSYTRPAAHPHCTRAAPIKCWRQIQR